MKKVSFDFDSTLDRPQIQEYASELIEIGLEVWIVTSRMSNHSNDWSKDWNDDLFKVAKRVGIPEKRIKFMEMEDKYVFFKDKDFVWHLDDDAVECNLINCNTNTFGISCWSGNAWHWKCKKLLVPLPTMETTDSGFRIYNAPGVCPFCGRNTCSGNCFK